MFSSEMDQELEVKFLVGDRAALENRLLAAGAQPVTPRTHEHNLRFDTAGSELTRSLQVLRLRQDQTSRLTYKGPSNDQDGASLRREIEFEVSDFEAARRLLEALGYRVSMVYEKYRAEYQLPALAGLEDRQNAVRLMVDEMPFGDFIEIEGPATDALREAARRLDLVWEARILESYAALFEKLRNRLHLPFEDLTFANFSDRSVRPEELGVLVGDR